MIDERALYHTLQTVPELGQKYTDYGRNLELTKHLLTELETLHHSHTINQKISLQWFCFVLSPVTAREEQESLQAKESLSAIVFVVVQRHPPKSRLFRARHYIDVFAPDCPLPK